MLYDDAPATLVLDAGAAISTTLVPTYYVADSGAGGSNVHDEAAMDGANTVWEVQVTAAGNFFLNSGDMSAYEGVAPGVKFVNMADNAEFRFDLKVLEIDPSTELVVKLDSAWPNVSTKSIAVPEIGVWTPVTVPFSELAANTIQPGQVNYDNVINLFVIEPTNNVVTTVQVDNIRIVCPEAAGCDMEPVPSTIIDENFFVFEDAVNDTLWEGLAYDAWTDLIDFINQTIVPETGRGDVLQVEFGTGFGTMYFKSANKKDLSAFDGGNLVFDIKVVTQGANTGDFRVKAEGGGSGPEVPFTVGALNVWETKTIPVATLAVPNLSAVDVPASIFPPDGQQDGVVFQLDNVRWELPTP